MKFKITKAVLDVMFEKNEKKDGVYALPKVNSFLSRLKEEYSRYNYRREDFYECDSASFPKEFIDEFIIELSSVRSFKGKNVLLQQVNTWKNLLQNPIGAKVSNIRGLADALLVYITGASKKNWIYIQDASGFYSPALVKNIRFYETVSIKDNYVPAHVKMECAFSYFGCETEKTYTFYTSHVRGGVTCQELLEKNNIYLQNDVLDDEYFHTISRYQKLKVRIGSQFSAKGVAFERDENGRYNNWTRDTVYFGNNDIIDKIIIDEDPGYKKMLLVSSVLKRKITDDYDIFSDIDGNDDDENDSGENKEDKPQEEEDRVALPISPYLKIFSLRTYSFYNIHVSNVFDYIYDPSLGEKLILPQEHKDLINTLIEGSKNDMEDIIRGKTGGIIILATGFPGVGKTLTAEVYSEVVRKPLYIVQASQLGMDVSDIEKNLKIVLERASRWGVILLLDECDVYLRQRGIDIMQNAIVGVFLRVLEYYSGILFMTTNRGIIIDDAILSRVTAHIRYGAHSMEGKTTIWKNLLKQFNLSMSEEDVLACIHDPLLKNITGRDIKSMLKLAGLLSKSKNISLDKKQIMFAFEFQDILQDEKQTL